MAALITAVESLLNASGSATFVKCSERPLYGAVSAKGRKYGTRNQGMKTRVAPLTIVANDSMPPTPQL